MPELTASGIDPSLETLRKIEQEEANTRAKAPHRTFAQLADDFIGIYPKPNRENWEEHQRILHPMSSPLTVTWRQWISERQR